MSRHLVSIFVFLFVSFSSTCFSGSLSVNESIWESLSSEEKKLLSQSHTVELYIDNKYGRIINSQTVDNSYHNTGAMSEIGSLYGQAHYIDKHDYKSHSFREQIGAGILGAFIGGLLDTPTQIEFQTRYALRLNNGDVLTKDGFSQNQFSLPVGVCIDVHSLSIVNDKFCQPADLNSFKKQYLNSNIINDNKVDYTSSVSEDTSIPKEITVGPNAGRDQPVVCKVGNSPPFKTSKHKCLIIKGKIIQ